MESDIKKIDSILNFWFGNIVGNEIPSEAHRKKWWIKNYETDEQIRSQFGYFLEMAITGDFQSWSLTANGSLALIILLDQFSRNIYRDKSHAFSQDQKALVFCLEGIKRGFDCELHPVQRIFFYMPLMHSEDISIQEKSIKCFSNLVKQFKTPEPIANMVSGSYDYALKHYEIIKRFGRYPHRNGILGRASTPEEIEFLKQPGSSF